MSRRRVLIGVPAAGFQLSAGVLTSVSRALSSQVCDVNVVCQGLSLLARNFNSLFVQAIKGEYDYFLLHHADLCVTHPTDVWLDVLVRRIEQLHCAAVSAAVPIKNQAGLFSMGLALNNEEYPAVRRVTATELSRLPESFILRSNLCEIFDVDPEKVGAMLVNTGVLLLNLREYNLCQYGWPGFSISDRIAWSRDAEPELYTMPEDWRFSKWLFEKQIPYVATKEVVVTHFGSASFCSNVVWGNATDDTTRRVSPAEWEQSYTKPRHSMKEGEES